MSANTQEELGQITASTNTSSNDTDNSSDSSNTCVRCLKGSFRLCKTHVLTPTFVLVCGVGCSSLLILEGFLCFSLCSINLRSYTLAFYYICFGLMTISAELQIQQLLIYFRILESYFGKGLWYLFLGIAAIGSEWWAVTIAILVIVVGVINLVGSLFLPSRQLPNTLGNSALNTAKQRNHQSNKSIHHNNIPDSDENTTITNGSTMVFDERTQLSVTQSSITKNDEGLTSSQEFDGQTQSSLGLSNDQQSSLVRNAVNPSTIAAIHGVASDEHVRVAMEDAVEVHSNPFMSGAYD